MSGVFGGVSIYRFRRDERGLGVPQYTGFGVTAEVTNTPTPLILGKERSDEIGDPVNEHAQSAYISQA